MTNPLAFWTAEQLGGIAAVIGAFGTVIVAVTGMIVAMRAGTRSKEAVVKAESANKSADTANDRASNNAKAITGVQQQLTQVALQTPPAPTSPVIPVEFPSGGSEK